MEVYLLRHGEAEERGTGIADKDRALTPKGKRDVRAVMEAARAAKVMPERILTSALRRAKETAVLAGSILDCRNVVETAALMPAASPERIWKELSGESILLCGHEPHMGHLIRFLLEARVAVDLKKGALVRIDVEGQGSPNGILKWILTPRLARRG